MAGFTASAVATATFTVDPSGQSVRPTITPRGGWFDSKQAVTVAATSGATVRYTLNGADPTTSDPEVPVGGLAIDRSRLLKVRAWETGLTPSAVARADFAVTGAVAAGHEHTLVLATDGTVWAWGNNAQGQLGVTGVASTTTPVQVLTDVATIAAGRRFSLAAKRDGTVWRWGLGTGATPTQVTGLTNVIAVSGGDDHQLALRSDGTVWAWGDNSAGQLGDGTTTTRTAPVQVLGLRGVRSIAAGDDFSLAVQDDGAVEGVVWAWGTNTFNQLGDDTTAGRSIPTRVPVLSNVAQVAAGNAFAIARLSDGTVRTWGKNDFGQLGVGSAAVLSGIHHVEPLMRVRAIAAGEFHALALDADGRAWAWGSAGHHLGAPPDGTAAVSPQLVVDIPDALAIAGGWVHTMVLRADGTARAMGVGTATSSAGLATTGITVAGFTVGDQATLVADQDGDGLPTWRELARGTDPLSADTNGNGLSDLIEIDLPASGSHVDDDGDGLASAAEIVKGTDPFLADTDGDGVNDRLDAFPLDPTRHNPLTPTPGDVTPPAITLTEPTNAVPLP